MDILIQNINQLNKTMMILETNIDNYIASNDLTLKAINDTLQYVVKTPMVIMVPNSEEIDKHRSEFSKMQFIRSNLTLRWNRRKNIRRRHSV